MRKRYVQATIKSTGKVLVYPTVAKMYEDIGEKVVGVTINTIWNALAKNKGRYENGQVVVEYKHTEVTEA